MDDAGAAVADTGLTRVYKPNGEPIVDLIFVHGLQGHPLGTWTCTKLLSHEAGNISRSFTKPGPPNIFWPQDLLPEDCPDAQIWTWGYDTKVTKGYEASNHNSLFAHARDLLFALKRKRDVGRPLVFVAHSLGGIIVKEVLRRSKKAEDDEDHELYDIIVSTKAVVFLGTPHRGSPGFANLGQTLRSIASGLIHVDSNNAILRALGVDSPELELGLEEFIPLWNKYKFRVKTFQESLPLMGVKIGRLNDLIVPPHSSTLGDRRENAETIQANHRDMCRFWGRDDHKYDQVGGELKDIVDRIAQSSPDKAKPAITQPSADKEESAIALEDNCIRSISYLNMDFRYRSIKVASQNTCQWIFSHQSYQAWRRPQQDSPSKGLIWLKGKPGSGKSTLMKTLYSESESTEMASNSITAAFFFNGRGGEMEKSPNGLTRSILHQILRKDRLLGAELFQLYSQRMKFEVRNLEWEWTDEELHSFLRQILRRSRKRVDIFVDGLDECSEPLAREVVEFCRDITIEAHDAGNSVNICLASRHYPNISTTDCPEIMVDVENKVDISTYSTNQLRRAFRNEEELQDIVNDITLRSRGIFLWAVFAVSSLKAAQDKGKNIKNGSTLLAKMPPSLEKMFQQIVFTEAHEEDQAEALLLWHWVTFSLKPLNILELRHAIRFGGDIPPPRSMKEWQKEEDEFSSSLVFAKRVLDLSRGLIEVQNMVFKRLPKSNILRINENFRGRRNAIVGTQPLAVDRHSWSKIELSDPGRFLNPRRLSTLSLNSIGSKWRQRISVASSKLDAPDRDDNESDDGAEPARPDFTRDDPNGLEGTRVQFIHESVREFFLSTGVRLISKSSQQAALGYGHLVLGRTCLNYLSVSELADIRSELDVYRYFNYRDFSGHPRTWELPGYALLPYVALFCVEHTRIADREGFAPNFFLEKASLIPTLNVLRNLVSLETGGQRPFAGFDNVLLFLCREQFLETVQLCVRDERFAGQVTVKNFQQEDALAVLLRYATNPTDKAVTALANEITKAKAAETQGSLKRYT